MFWNKKSSVPTPVPQPKGLWTIDKELWTIDKEFRFDYGHRVHNQRLNKEYSIVDDCVCKHLHGHGGCVHIYLEADELEGGFVTDFHHLNWVKHFLDAHVDHKFVLDVNDPWFSNIINGKPIWVATPVGSVLAGLEPTLPLNTTDATELHLREVYVPGTDHRVGWELKVDDLQGPEREFFEGFFLVKFVPTSENLCKWLFDAVEAKMSLINVHVSKVSWNETPKSRAVYSRPV